MSLENTEELKAYLLEHGLISDKESCLIHTLSGGVSGETLWVQVENGSDFVIKQALPKLKVKEDWYSDPARIHIEAAAMRALQELLPSGSVPCLLHEDHDLHLIAMEAVLQPHTTWKSLLLKGKLDLDHFRQFASMLAGIHRQSFKSEPYQQQFADRRFFETLRLEPYYKFTATQVPVAADFLHALIADCRKVQLSLVHGDYSPKNVLIHQNRLILIDHEVMHFGDGAFDIGFSMTHFLSKAFHVPHQKARFLEAAWVYWQNYAANFPLSSAWEQRAIRHTLACMLARVRGKSPLEYLSDQERREQEARSLMLMIKPPVEMLELIENIGNI